MYASSRPRRGLGAAGLDILEKGVDGGGGLTEPVEASTTDTTPAWMLPILEGGEGDRALGELTLNVADQWMGLVDRIRQQVVPQADAGPGPELLTESTEVIVGGPGTEQDSSSSSSSGGSSGGGGAGGGGLWPEWDTPSSGEPDTFAETGSGAGGGFDIGAPLAELEERTGLSPVVALGALAAAAYFAYQYVRG